MILNYSNLILASLTASNSPIHGPCFHMDFDYCLNIVFLLSYAICVQFVVPSKQYESRNKTQSSECEALCYKYKKN